MNCASPCAFRRAEQRSAVISLGRLIVFLEGNFSRCRHSISLKLTFSEYDQSFGVKSGLVTWFVHHLRRR